MGFVRFLKSKISRLPIVITTALVLLLMLSTVVLASYVHKAIIATYLATAADFYFTSDLLTDAEEPPVYQIVQQANGEAEIEFELRNYQDELNPSSKDITYSVTVDPAKATPPNGTISADAEKSTVTFTVTNDSEPMAPLEILVTAKSKKPFSKTLKGKFIITPPITYEMDENSDSPVGILNVTLAPAPGPQLTREVTIAWLAGAAPDRTNPIVIAAAAANKLDLTNRTLTTTLNTAATYELVFFKDPPSGDYAAYTNVTAELAGTGDTGDT